MAKPLVDFHCHLDLYPDFSALVEECEAQRIYTVGVTTTPRAWPRNHSLASPTRYVRAALGLHPQLVSEQASELTLWEEYLPQARFVGEVGLDAGPRFFRSLQLQKEVFERILRQCAQAGGKILSVHSVRSAKAVLDLVEKHLPADRGRVVLHWFAGSASDARRAVLLGCYFSLNAQMFQTDAQRQLIAALPLDRILTESDGPFTKTGARVTRPGDVARVGGMIARARGCDANEVAVTILSNAKALIT